MDATASPDRLRYDCDRALLSPGLRDRFLTLSPDADLERFLRAAADVRPGRLRVWAFRRLRRWLSDYDAYGITGLYHMHLLSTGQWRSLLAEREDATPHFARMLDVGAGRGDITRALLPLVGQCDATESARFLRRELPQLGVRVCAWDLGQAPVPSDERYDLITCLNVIDRTARPRTLLRHSAEALLPGGRLVVSVPLPLRPHVDRGRRTVDQDEALPECGEAWEAAAGTLAAQLFDPLGLTVLRLTRAPYVSHLERPRETHALDTAIFLLEARAERPPTLT